MQSCNRHGCEETARWVPILVMRPLGYPPKTPHKIRGRMGLLVCDTHKAEGDVDDYVSGEGFVVLLRGLQAAGVGAQDPDVELDWEPIPTCSKAGCEDQAAEEILLTVREPGETDPTEIHHYSMQLCPQHLLDFNREMIERPLSELTTFERLHYGPTTPAAN